MQVLCDLRPTFLKCNCQTPEAIEKYIADHSDQYKSMNDFICQTLEEKIKQD